MRGRLGLTGLTVHSWGHLRDPDTSPATPAAALGLQPWESTTHGRATNVRLQDAPAVVYSCHSSGCFLFSPTKLKRRHDEVTHPKSSWEGLLEPWDGSRLACGVNGSTSVSLTLLVNRKTEGERVWLTRPPGRRTYLSST